MEDPKILDVAVVGGGVSGVYSAWRLLSNSSSGEKPAIQLFEYSKRIGGRLVSVTPPGMPNTRCELGGMRFTSTQKLVKSLVMDKLKLKTKDFNVSEKENIAYIRRQRLRVEDLSNPDKLPYNLSWWERQVGLGNLMALAVDQIIPGASTMNDKEWEETREKFQIDGKYIFDYGFWNLLLRSLTSEGYDYLQGSSGYFSPTANWNAYDAIRSDLSDFGSDVKYFGLINGYQEVPLKLASLFEEQGGKLNMEHRLMSFDTVQLPDGQSGVLLKFDHGGKEKEVYARQVILAMPRAALDQIEKSGSVLGDQAVQDLIASVDPAPFFKIFVCYPYPWWEELGLSKGQSVTDLPVRQCYYWGVEEQGKEGNPNLKNSVLLASYDDRRMVSFWGGLKTKKIPAFETNFAHVPDGEEACDSEDDWNDYKAPKDMVEEVHRQLLEIHDVKYAPRPYAAAFMDWSGGVFGGGVNFWNIHVKSWEVIPKIMKPKEDAPVYICGSAYSNFQGWVEGALQTAESMLENHFGLPSPDWLEK